MTDPRDLTRLHRTRIEICEAGRPLPPRGACPSCGATERDACRGGEVTRRVIDDLARAARR